MPGVSVEPDGVCPWCGLRAQAFALIHHAAYEHNPGVRRQSDWWDVSGLVVMLIASLALIAVAVVGALS
jgi:hypothetical protein